MSDVMLSMPSTARVDGNLAEPRDYFDLLKPRVMSLVVFTALAGMLAAPHPMVDGFTDTDYYKGAVIGVTDSQRAWVAAHLAQIKALLGYP